MAADDKRVALVIGNSAYVNAMPLKNPRNDAEAMGRVLGRLGFDVISSIDLGRDAMEDKLVEFEAAIGGASAAMLFYAGHGLQVKGHNYLIPVDADIRQEIQLKRRAFSLDELLDIMVRRARASLIFLDACRDNPFSRSLLSGMSDQEQKRYMIRSGLAEVKASQGSFIAFATAPDNVAHDGKGTNSPFTEAMVAHIETPGVSVSDLMIEVRKDVLRATDGRQEPWDQSSLRERFCFKALSVVEPIAPSQETPSPMPAAFDPQQMELTYWAQIKDSNNSDLFEAFLRQFPDSVYSALAKRELEAMQVEAERRESDARERGEAEARAKAEAEARWRREGQSHAKAEAAVQLLGSSTTSGIVVNPNVVDKIFINYRRDDRPAHATLIRDRLAPVYGPSKIFMDVANLLPGEQFAERLEKELAGCDVLLAVIGPRWLELLEARLATGERDYVREEIATALKRRIIVVPVLVDRAELPPDDRLPEDIRSLVLYQKHGLTHERVDRDANELITAINAVREKIRAEAAPTQQQPAKAPRSMGALTVGIAAAVVLLAVSFGFWTWQKGQSPNTGTGQKSGTEFTSPAQLDPASEAEREAIAAARATKSIGAFEDYLGPDAKLLLQSGAICGRMV